MIGLDYITWFVLIMIAATMGVIFRWQPGQL